MPRVAVPELVTPAEDPGNWSFWLYGDWGTGKTVLAAGMPDVIVIDTEKSRRSLLNHTELLGVPIFPVLNFDEFKAVVDKIILANDSTKDDLQILKIQAAKTIVIDTWSTLQMKELNSQMKKLIIDKPHRDPDLPSEAEFNINNTRLRKALIDLLERSGKNIIIISHVKEEKDEKGQTIVIRPGNSPSITQTIASLVDGVFYLTSRTNGKGETTRKLQCMPSNTIRAKNRFSRVIAREIENPKATDIMQAIEEQQQVALDLLNEQRTKANAGN